MRERCAAWPLRRIGLDVAAVGLPLVTVLLSAREPGGAAAVGVLACVVLVWRYRWPRVVAVVCAAALTGGLGWAPLVVSYFALARSRPQVSALAPWLALATVCAVVPVLWNESLSWGAVVLTLGFSVVASASPLALGVLVRTRQELAGTVARLRAATEAESVAREEAARAEERARIAREIHDAVGHHATLIAVEAAALAATADDEPVRASALRLRSLAKAALDEMRSTLRLDGEESGVAAVPAARGIRDLVARANEARGVRVEFSDESDPARAISAGVGRAAYRVVQEALTNAAKHAPGSVVEVRLQDATGVVRLSVVNGPPTTAPVDVGGSGYGLAGLSERVRIAGGELHGERSPDGGFRLLVELPSSYR